MPEGADAATLLGREHREIERLSRLVGSLDRSSERAVLVCELSDRFLTHAAAEERYLYPALRRFLPHGEADALDQVRRQRAAARIVESIERTDEFDATVDALVAQLVVDIRRHVGEQDGVLLPALAGSCPLEESDRLGRRIRGWLRRTRA
jgi:hemerythrin superfamily protein